MSYEIVNGNSRQFTTPVPPKWPCAYRNMTDPKIDSWGPTQEAFGSKPKKDTRRVHDGPVPLGRFSRADFRRGLR